MSIKRFTKLAGIAAVVAVVGVVMMWVGRGDNDNPANGGGGGGGGSGTFVDSRDGTSYKFVTIGSQTWMAENLNYKTDNSWCYANDDSNCVKYGRLYTWDAAIKACPAGWSLPTNDDWDDLVKVAGGLTAGTVLKSTTGWSDNGNGTDDFGFSALPGGCRSTGGSFGNVGGLGGWWAATEYDAGYAYYRGMDYGDIQHVYRGGSSKDYGYSARCVKN